ncbi:hypothetical protein N8152_00435 [bacterium]|nr:hypothetical protein [bacterium]
MGRVFVANRNPRRTWDDTNVRRGETNARVGRCEHTTWSSAKTVRINLISSCMGKG